MSKVIDYISGCGGGKFTWTVKTTSFDIDKSYGYFIDTSSNPITATVPQNAEIGDAFYIVDSTGAVDESNKVIINNNGHNIMGYQDNLEITEKFMSLYMVYADASKGWVIADGKGCDEDVNGGEISIDKTLYMAPSASSHSPTGVAVGSDITGIGTYDQPFYSIKGVMDYMSNFSIKEGVIVTVRGLPGKYYYNNDHSVEIKHKDIKHMRFMYDMIETGNYHETYMTTDAVTVTNRASDDLITFKVVDMGTGFYKIQPGDYIKIVPNNDLLDQRQYALWNGFYEVESTDDSTKEISIVYKRYYDGSGYGPQTTTPTTLAASNTVKVVKLSTHQYINTTKSVFIKSDYGIDGFSVVASNVNYQTGFNGTYLGIYDGVIQYASAVISGFGKGVMFKNLQFGFDYSNNLTYTTFTSCENGISCDDSYCTIIGYSCNNSKYGIECGTSSLSIGNTSIKMLLCNMYYDGISLYNSIFRSTSSNNDINVTNCFNCRNGIHSWFTSSILYNSYNIANCNIGIFLDKNSSVQFSYNDVPQQSNISNCTYAIEALNNSNVDASYTNMLNCTNGCYISGSTITNLSNSSFFITNCNIGINLNRNSYASIYNITISGNGGSNSIGVYSLFSKQRIENINIYNTRYGVLAYFSTIDLRSSSIDCNNISNSYGVYLQNMSNIRFYNSGVSNATNDMVCRESSICHSYVPSADGLQNTSPAKNTSPTYNNYYIGGNYIMETTY